MKANEFKLKAPDGVDIHIYQWLPTREDEILGIVQIAHGMAEQGARYAHFAEFLCNNGFAVYANDHRGQGKAAGDLENVGYIAKSQGWDKLVSDQEMVSSQLM